MYDNTDVNKLWMPETIQYYMCVCILLMRLNYINRSILHSPLISGQTADRVTPLRWYLLDVVFCTDT